MGGFLWACKVCPEEVIRVVVEPRIMPIEIHWWMDFLELGTSN
jgi:hypothetical protein